MSKITFDFSGSETQRPEIEIEARCIDIIYATAVLIDFLINTLQKAEKEPYKEKQKKVLAMVQMALDGICKQKIKEKKRWRTVQMNDDDFEIITDKIIKVLQILFLAILCGLGMLLLITGIVTALS